MMEVNEYEKYVVWFRLWWANILKDRRNFYFSDELARVYIRNYVEGDRPKFMVKMAFNFIGGVVLQGHYNCITELTDNIENVCIFD